MRAAILTREYPPDVYGGAGVHVDFLVRELRGLLDVDVHCMGEPRLGATAHSEDDPRIPGANAALRVLSTDLTMTAAVAHADLVHSHTWYANMAGHWAKLLYDVPHVVTAHSLEPRRPWKAEQLGGGYRLSSWAERTAYEAADAIIAVSNGMRDDVLDCYPAIGADRVHVIHNGIDAEFYHPDPQTMVLVAGAADTAELKTETDALVEELRAKRDGVFVISEMLPREQVRQVLTHALAFCCPSVYEPLGIVNLEAMACETAVVASAVGGIPEVVDDGSTGTLVPYDEHDPAGFEASLADAINALVADPGRAAAMGKAGRERAISAF